jgi:hypothetical protein
VKPINPDRQTLADLVNLDAMPIPPGRRAHQRRFDAAAEIQVLQRDEAVPSRNMHKQPVGIGIYRPVPRVDTDDCRHELTICRSCRRQWEQDHFVGIFDHGTPTAYRNQGCRCTPCRYAATDLDTATRYPPPPPSGSDGPDRTQPPFSGNG